MRLSLTTNKYSFHIAADSLFHCCSSIFRSGDYVSESPSGARTGVIAPPYRTINVTGQPNGVSGFAAAVSFGVPPAEFHRVDTNTLIGKPLPMNSFLILFGGIFRRGRIKNYENIQ